jgi:hypothetical protein
LAWNAAKEFGLESAGGLIAKTMPSDSGQTNTIQQWKKYVKILPDLQWLPCRQYIHTVLESVTWC